VDFVGINSPNRGDFKTSFDAVPARYFLVTWQKAKVSEAAYLRVDRSVRSPAGRHLGTSHKGASSGQANRSLP